MIYTLNLTDNFAKELVDFVLSQATDPFEIAKMEIILPTKRAVKTVKDTFVKQSEKTPLLLPKLTPLYDIETLEEDILPAISPIERLILLTRLCQKKPNVDTFEHALTIAISLSSLLDEFYQYEATIDDLDSLVPNMDLAKHWHETVDFLDIIQTVWPALLKEKGRIDLQDRKIRLINAYIKKIKKNPPKNQIIMAGFDGAIPAVSRLMQELTQHENTVILLQGLNTDLTTDDLNAIDDNHYHYSFKKLLSALKLYPQQIENLSKELSLREEFIIEALRPAEQVCEWRTLNLDESVLNNVTRIDCENINEEALTIALILRKTLETPLKTAALVTNDRMLARRVILEMKRWGIELDDSAGTPLHHTPVGVYLSLIASFGKEPSSSNFLSLLKHPLSADQKMPTDFRKEVKIAEKEARKKSKSLQMTLNTDFETFLSYFKNNKPTPFDEILTEHLKIAEDLATSSDKTGEERLWGNEAGQEAYKLFVELKEYGEKFGAIHPMDYPGIIELFLSGVSVRAKYGMHQRLDILGPIEARLTHPDVCIIAGLNEGSFPMLSDMGPWLSRGMRKSLKLPAIENKIASQSMDFAHCFLSPEVYLTRSVKSDGSQTIPSRFISRMEAVLNASDIKWDIKSPDYARLMDKTDKIEQSERPAPTPPVSSRPTELSVTNIELLMKNPYAIYAKYILKLLPLKDIEELQENIVYGSALHKVLEEFLKKDPLNISPEKFKERAIELLKENGFSEADLAFYDEKIEKVSEFIANEQTFRQDITNKVIPEQVGEITFKLQDGSDFKLTAKADRIDDLKGNLYEIIDYKTGTPPTGTDIESGLTPQMTLEGVILREKGFKELTKTKDITLSYWHLTGKKKGGEIISIPSKKSKKGVSNLIEEAYTGLKEILNKFRNEETPYIASPRPDKVTFNDYALLSREKEWLNEEDEEA